MKRIRIVRTAVRSEDLFSEDIVELMTRLKLLYEVPFSYLVTEENVLPPESLRFFCIDGNWTDALVQGALSLGRVSEQDGDFDRAVHRVSAPAANCRLRQVRLGLMHENHKRDTEGKEQNRTRLRRSRPVSCSVPHWSGSGRGWRSQEKAVTGRSRFCAWRPWRMIS